jgi:hypothetical protein
LGNETAPQPRDFGCPADYDAIDMMAYDDVVKSLEAAIESDVKIDVSEVAEA